MSETESTMPAASTLAIDDRAMANKPCMLSVLHARVRELEQQVKLQTLDGVTRFEVIDHTKDGGGRALVRYGIRVQTSLQDEGRTLKIFLT